MSEKSKPVAIVTPTGIAKYPRLNEPDTKFKPEGEYKATIILNVANKGVKEFLKLVADAEEAALAEFPAKKGKKQKVADSIIKDHYDEQGNPLPGQYEITAKTKASGVFKAGPKAGQKWERKPAMFDAKGLPVKNAKVGSGSKLKLSVNIASYESPAVGVGVSLYLNAVQIIDLVEFTGGASAAQHGFGAEEGFEAPAAAFDDASNEEKTETADETKAEPTGEPETDAPAPTQRRRGDF